MAFWSGCGPREAASSSRGVGRRAGSESPSKAGLLRRERLCAGRDYRRVFREGTRMEGRLFLLLVVENREGRHRLGLAVSRRLGGAVVRNRVKRLLRESFRRNKPSHARGLDVVLVPKPEMIDRSVADVEREFRQRIERWMERRGHRRVPSPPHAD